MNKEIKEINGIEYVTSKYVAERWGVSKTTVHNWRREKEHFDGLLFPQGRLIPLHHSPLYYCEMIKIKGRIYYLREEIDEALEELTKNKIKGK